jgi:hypothetical protein
MSSTPKKKINKEILELKDIIGQMGLTDIYRIFPPRVAESTFFSTSHGTFFKMDYILVHKTILKKDKKIKITFCILLVHDGIKLKVSNKRNYRKYSST